MYVCCFFNAGGAVVVVPQGIESVNRSDVNMGCTISALVESGGVMVCSCGSIILDGISPTINTSTNTSDWASQLVTVRKNKQTTEIPYDYVLLTFGFDTAVSLTGIELDMFICPEWNIDAPVITVFADVENNLVFNGGSGLQFENYTPSQSSCNSLSTVTISLGGILTGRTWHIVAQGFPEFSPIEWVHVGEVRFLGADKYNSSKYVRLVPTCAHCTYTYVYMVMFLYMRPLSLASTFTPYTLAYVPYTACNIQALHTACNVYAICALSECRYI